MIDDRISSVPRQQPSEERTGIRNLGPLVDRVEARKRLERDVLAEHAREVESSSLNDEASTGKHGGTAVLELSSTEPGKSLVVSEHGKGKRVELLERLGASRHAIEGGLNGGRNLVGRK